MKNILLISFLCLINFFAKSQDLIIKHNGEIIKANVSGVTESAINFTYQNENVQNTITKNLVKEIQFASGRVQSISEKIVINGEDDWDKVIITTNPNDVIGLVRKGEVKSTASNTWNFKGQKGVDDKAVKKIKKEAASMKCHIILITEAETKGSTMISSAKSFKVGIAYSYQ